MFLLGGLFFLEFLVLGLFADLYCICLLSLLKLVTDCTEESTFPFSKKLWSATTHLIEEIKGLTSKMTLSRTPPF
jgi:hypothetical protein